MRSARRGRTAVGALVVAVLAGCGGAEDPPRLVADRDLRLPVGAPAGASAPDLPAYSGSTDDLPIVAGIPPVEIPPPPPPPEPLPPSDVLFATGSAVLTPAGITSVQDYARRLLRSRPQARVRLVGHTDSRGTTASNLELSLLRARAVLQQFVAAGFDPSRVTAAGAGEGRPLSPDTAATGVYDEARGRGNRRVEVQVRT